MDILQIGVCGEAVAVSAAHRGSVRLGGFLRVQPGMGGELGLDIRVQVH